MQPILGKLGQNKVFTFCLHRERYVTESWSNTWSAALVAWVILPSLPSLTSNMSVICCGSAQLNPLWRGLLVGSW